MGYFKNMQIEIMELLEYTFLSEEEIAKKLNIPLSEVEEIAQNYFAGDYDCDPKDLENIV